LTIGEACTILSAKRTRFPFILEEEEDLDANRF
jgi:hypothetical protein